MFKMCFVYQVSEQDVSYNLVKSPVLTTAETATRFEFNVVHNTAAFTANVVRCHFWLPLFAKS